MTTSNVNNYECNTMGRIKTKFIKRVTNDLYADMEDVLTKDFDENKKIVDSKLKISKKLRNIVAGYATRLKTNAKY